MRKIKIGTMLYRLRNEKGISGRLLCNGLCQVSTLSYYESNNRIPDSLLFFYFMQRLGAAPEDFAIMLSREEYDYYIWREKTTEEIENREWDKLEISLKEEITLVKCNEHIQAQYDYYLKAILALQKYENYQEGVYFLRKAAEQTIPDIFEISSDTILLGSTELNILINFLYYGTLNKALDEGTSRKLFWKLEKYISEGILEKDEQIKVYPKLICVWGRICDGKLQNIEMLGLCSKAVSLIKETYRLYDIVELLGMYTKVLKITNPKEEKKLEKQKLVIKEILEKNEIDTSFSPEVLRGRKPKIYLVNEYFYMYRAEQNLTQEDLSEGVCEPENYSRMERGIRKPTVRNYMLLAEKLKIGWGYYRGELLTDNFKLYELRRMHREAEIRGDREENLERLQEMEAELDMNEKENYQYIRSKQYMTRYYMGDMTEKVAYESNKKLMYMTIPADIDEKEIYYYSQTELEIIAQMGILLGKMKKYDEGIQLLENTLKKINNCSVDIEFQWNGAVFAIRVLSVLYFEQGRYDEAIQVAEYALRGNLRRMNAGTMLQTLDAIADSWEHKGERYSDKYMKLYSQVYYMADFFEFEKIKKFSGEYYEKLCGKKMDGYED